MIFYSPRKHDRSSGALHITLKWHINWHQKFKWRKEDFLDMYKISPSKCPRESLTALLGNLSKLSWRGEHASDPSNVSVTGMVNFQCTLLIPRFVQFVDCRSIFSWRLFSVASDVALPLLLPCVVAACTLQQICNPFNLETDPSKCHSMPGKHLLMCHHRNRQGQNHLVYFLRLWSPFWR